MLQDGLFEKRTESLLIFGKTRNLSRDRIQLAILKLVDDLFDLVITKEELVTEEPLKQATVRISSLAAAYKIIQSNITQKNNNFVSLSYLLGLTSREAEFVLNHQALRAIARIQYSHQIISKIMALLIQRPGVLLSDEHLLARLGVSPDSPNIPQLKAKLFVQELSYSGLLYEGWPRWWWHRVDTWAKELIGASLGSMTGDERVLKLSCALQIELKPAISKWSKSTNEYFWVACSSCDNPTELKHSVLGYNSNYQPFFEPSRICWFCIQTGEYERSDLVIDDSDESLADKIRSGKIQPQTQITS